MSTPCRKVVITAFGDISNLSIVQTSIPDPPKDHVQVRTIYSGFAGADINMRLGRYPMQKKAPLTPGYCLVGKVVKNGSGCSQFRTGDIVACLTVYDAEADYANLPQKYLVPVPDGTDLQQATALVCDWSTAYSMAINTAKVRSGQMVFVHGISGAVGYAALVLCQRQGAKVYGTCSERNFTAIENLGGTPFTYTNKDWIKAMKDLGGADAVFDPLGFESWDESYSILSPSGHLLGYGGNLATLNGQPERSILWPTIKLLLKNTYLRSGKKTTFFYITRDDKTFKPNLEKMLEMTRNGDITVPIKGVFDLEDIKTAHESWSKASGIGSFVVKVSDP
ncbi:MAG: hypothetical protein L6R40_008156 [Gallowayella cf. fulva]|nr:MAG: hypothetical protein L6R40_008156 [Xanthomendoza cf. fulva]